MRLSLKKAPHVAPFGTAYRKYGYLPGFGRYGPVIRYGPGLEKLRLG